MNKEKAEKKSGRNIVSRYCEEVRINHSLPAFYLQIRISWGWADLRFDSSSTDIIIHTNYTAIITIK